MKFEQAISECLVKGTPISRLTWNNSQIYLTLGTVKTGWGDRAKDGHPELSPIFYHHGSGTTARLWTPYVGDFWADDWYPVKKAQDENG